MSGSLSTGDRSDRSGNRTTSASHADEQVDVFYVEGMKNVADPVSSGATVQCSKPSRQNISTSGRVLALHGATNTQLVVQVRWGVRWTATRQL